MLKLIGAVVMITWTMHAGLEHRCAICVPVKDILKINTPVCTWITTIMYKKMVFLFFYIFPSTLTYLSRVISCFARSTRSRVGQLSYYGGLLTNIHPTWIPPSFPSSDLPLRCQVRRTPLIPPSREWYCRGRWIFAIKEPRELWVSLSLVCTLVCFPYYL